MGLHNFHTTYDTWRLSGPDDFQPRRRVQTAEFTREYELAYLHDIPADCAFSVSDGDVVTLEQVTISGKRFSADVIREWLGTVQIDQLEAEGQSYWSEEGAAKAEADDEADRGDYLYRLHRDE